jgi:hypothetical protein
MVILFLNNNAVPLPPAESCPCDHDLLAPPHIGLHVGTIHCLYALEGGSGDIGSVPIH